MVFDASHITQASFDTVRGNKRAESIKHSACKQEGNTLTFSNPHDENCIIKFVIHSNLSIRAIAQDSFGYSPSSADSVLERCGR